MRGMHRQEEEDRRFAWNADKKARRGQTLTTKHKARLAAISAHEARELAGIFSEGRT